MLKVLFGKELEGTVLSVDGYFNDVYEEDWFDNKDQIIETIIKDIDG